MKAAFAILLISAVAGAEEPLIEFDNRPEMGIPEEARDQGLLVEREGLGPKPHPFHKLTEGTIKTIRIRYFNKETWETEEQVREYVRGVLENKKNEANQQKIWSQAVSCPEIECYVVFTDEHKKNLVAENKRCRFEGRLVIWNCEACFRDATGRWWFVNDFDHFHAAHPKGTRRLASPANKN